ncbi:hypothetical protein BOX15_Mlig018325g1 [Macrostomum lignano]|uniref:SCP domain-containing protein n=1 Tax=Macrostomum lignano TaxID=282301 RepID=A0A267FGY5_9PLAT|nr:hypothetical protein BOX15_Mlig018325g1 [Macrostomum lignano]
MSCCSFCCPWRHQAAIDSKSEKSPDIEATSTSTSGLAFVQSKDDNNNKSRDCSVNARDVDDSVIIKQPMCDRTVDMERMALMRSMVASSNNSDHVEESFYYHKNDHVDVADSQSVHGETYDDCSKLEELDMSVDLRNEMELLSVSDLRNMQETVLLTEDSYSRLYQPCEYDFGSENGLNLRLTIDFDEQPGQDLLDLFQEVLKQRPETEQSQETETCVPELLTEEDLEKFVEEKMVEDTVEELSSHETNEALDSKLEQDLEMPSEREQNEELLQLLLTVYEQRIKQGRQKLTSRPKQQFRPYKRMLMPAIPPVDESHGRQLSPFEQQMLEAHNYYRARHNTPPLKPCPELRLRAQTWAEYIAQRDLQLLEHQELDGVNWGCVELPEGSNEVNGEFFVNGWYKQCQHYDYHGQKNPQISINDPKTTANFEQLIWKSSQLVGFGRAFSASGRVFVVARYRPPGRVSREYETNVLPPVG